MNYGSLKKQESLYTESVGGNLGIFFMKKRAAPFLASQQATGQQAPSRGSRTGSVFLWGAPAFVLAWATEPRRREPLSGGNGGFLGPSIAPSSLLVMAWFGVIDTRAPDAVPKGG